MAAPVPSRPSKVSTRRFAFLQHPAQPPIPWAAFPGVGLDSLQKPKAPSASHGGQQSLVLVLLPQSPRRDRASVTAATATGITEEVCRATAPTAAPHRPRTSTAFREFKHAPVLFFHAEDSHCSGGYPPAAAAPKHGVCGHQPSSAHMQGSEEVRNWLSTRAEGPARLPLPSPQNDCVLCSSRPGRTSRPRQRKAS